MKQASVNDSGHVVLGRYRIVRELARGGMGMVYLGRVEGAAGFSKPVVVKRVLNQLDKQETLRAQFVREARILSELHHPSIVGVIDFGEADDSYLMVLEYVHGYNLGYWHRFAKETRGNFEWDFAVYSVIKTLGALHYAHTHVGSDGKVHPIIHRDVSPGNVLVDLQGNVRLLDFGIARTTDDAEEHKTQEGMVKGKLPYIAPEIYQSVEASPLSDVYSTGVMLYQLLSGKNPFNAKDMSSIVARVLSHEPPPIASLRDDVPDELDQVLFKALKKKPSERFASAAEFAEALARLLPGPEASLLERFRSQISLDFLGELPRHLDVPSLALLDAAWRESAPDPAHEASLLRSSFPPSDQDATAVVAVGAGVDVFTARTVVASPLELQKGKVSRFEAETRTAPLVGLPSADVESGTTKTMLSRVPVAPASRSNWGVLIGAALVAGGVAAAVVYFGQSKAPPPTGQRYLVVERQGQTASAPAPAAAPVAAPAAPAPVATPAPAPAPALAPVPTAVKTTSTRTDAERLTSAFAAHEGAIQGCFSRHPSADLPAMSVRFQVSGTGALVGTQLNPGSIAGSPLGACLLGVAQRTKFPSLGKDVAFSIPITARVVRR